MILNLIIFHSHSKYIYLTTYFVNWNQPNLERQEEFWERERETIIYAVQLRGIHTWNCLLSPNPLPSPSPNKNIKLIFEITMENINKKCNNFITCEFFFQIILFSNSYPIQAKKSPNYCMKMPSPPIDDPGKMKTFLKVAIPKVLQHTPLLYSNNKYSMRWTETAKF